MAYNKKIAVILIILFGLFIRLIRIDQPLTDFSTRQVETAMVARNFYCNGFKIFYPEWDFVCEKGNTSIISLEFGLVPFIAAFLYKISGGVHEYWGRIVSIIFWLGSAVIFYRWLLFFGYKLAVYGLIVYTFLPLSIILSRTFQPEMAMLFFSISGLYCLTRYSLKEGEMNLWTGSILVSMAILLKGTAMSLLLPSMFLILRRKKDVIRFLLAGSLIVSLPLAWYSRGLLLSKMYPSMVSATNWSLGNWFSFSSWFRPEDWRDIFINLWDIVLTPIGFFLFVLGIFLRKKISVEYLFYYWTFGIAIFLLLFFYHARTHIYYWLPLMPAAAYFIASGLTFLDENHIKERIYKNIFSAALLISVIAIMIFHCVYPAYRIPMAYAKVGEMAEAVNTTIPLDSYVIASCSAGPYFLYYCARNGWDFWVNNPNINSIEYLESLREKGAEYFASANLAELNKNKVFSKYLYDNYGVIWEKKSSGIIFSLKK